VDASLSVTFFYIDVGQNNRLFAPGTDMDRERLRLSHMQKGRYYIQIYDKCSNKLGLSKSPESQGGIFYVIDH
jgi:hypothetical protein